MSQDHLSQEHLSYIIPASDYRKAFIDLYKFVPFSRYDHLKTQKEVKSFIFDKQSYLDNLLLSFPEHYFFMIKIRVEIDMLWQRLFELQCEQNEQTI